MRIVITRLASVLSPILLGICALIPTKANENNLTTPNLAQTAGYILSGGFVETNDMKKVDEISVRVPSYIIASMSLTPEMTMKVVSPKDCLIEVAATKESERRARFHFHLNNVIPREVSYEETSARWGLSKVFLVGENNVACMESDGARQCFRKWDIAMKTDGVSRMQKALSYLFSEFCAPARRRSPF